MTLSSYLRGARFIEARSSRLIRVMFDVDRPVRGSTRRLVARRPRSWSSLRTRLTVLSEAPVSSLIRGTPAHT